MVFFAHTLCLMYVLGGQTAFPADPVIHVTWDEPGDPPLADTDYQIFTTSPASPEFPDVELRTGSLTWQIWSTDTDNPGNVGDIGEIRCPYAQNFAVSIRNDSHPTLTGARTVKAIRLVPSSTSNYANITEARIAGLTDELIVAPNSSGTGGEVYLLMSGGPHTADMTISKANRFQASGTALSGTINIGELAGQWDSGPISGNVTIARATLTSEQLFGAIRVLGIISGSLAVEEIDDEKFYFFNPSDVPQTGRITFGNYVANNPPAQGDSNIELGGTSGSAEIAGTIEFLGEVPWPVLIWSDLTATGSIDLNGGEVSGSLTLLGGGSGTIANGGTLTGTVTLGSVYHSTAYLFTGTATFENVATTGKIIAGAGNMTGTIQITGTSPMSGDIRIGNATDSVNIGTGGFIDVTPPLAYGASVTVHGSVLHGGRIRLANEMGSGSELDISGNVDSGGLVQLEKGLASGGLVEVGGNLAAAMEIGTASGFGGTVSGQMTVGGNLSGTLSHYGLATATGVIELGPVTSTGKYNQTLTNPTGSWEGSLTVNGNMAGLLSFQTKLEDASVMVEGSMSGTIRILEMYDSSLTLNTVNYCSNNTSGTIEIGAKSTVWTPNSGTNHVDLNNIAIWGEFLSSARLKFIVYQWTATLNSLGTVCYKRANYGQEQVIVPSGVTPPSVIHCPSTTDPCCTGC